MGRKKLENMTPEQLNALIAAEEEMMKKEWDDDNKKAIKDGYTHRIDAWIHPSQGDDRQISMFSIGAPSDAMVQAFLKKKRSEILTDYKIIALKDL